MVRHIRINYIITAFTKFPRAFNIIPSNRNVVASWRSGNDSTRYACFKGKKFVTILFLHGMLVIHGNKCQYNHDYEKCYTNIQYKISSGHNDTAVHPARNRLGGLPDPHLPMRLAHPYTAVPAQ